MTTDIELSWLAGLWDGEGSITVWRYVEGKRIRYIATLVLTNTNAELIAQAVKIMDSFGVRMHLHCNMHDNPKHKDAYQLTSKNLQAVKLFLDTLKPFLVGKRAQAELTLRFVNSRLSKYDSDGHGWSNYQTYDNEEIDIAEQLMKLNKRGKSSTTKRLTPQGEDIV